jgi:cytochrome c oxidase subunit IV
MQLMRFTNYMLQHRIQFLIGMMLLACLSILDPTGVIGSIVATTGILIAAFMTLSRGGLEGLFFTIAATLPYVVVFYAYEKQNNTIPLFFWIALLVAILSNIVTLIAATMLQRQMRWSVIIQLATLSGVLVVSLLHLIYPDIANWWSEQLQLSVTQLAAVTGKSAQASVPSQDARLEFINLTKYYATGLLIACILFEGFFQLALARWWQAAVFAPGALRKELHHIRLSPLAGVLFVVSIVLSYLGNSTVLDIMPIVYLLFCVAGLSLVHYFFGLMTSPTKWFWLMLLYTTLLLSMPVGAMLVAMIGLADVWMDMRRRFTKS